MQFRSEDGMGDLPVDVPQIHGKEQTFSINGSILVPGVKHMMDNIQQDTLSKLSWYPTFSAAWRIQLKNNPHVGWLDIVI